MATDPVPAWIDSTSTLELELDPRPDGMTSTRPVTFTPNCGWCTSITRPDSGSTPPQKLSGSSRTSARPRASPAARVRASPIGPQALVAPYTAALRRTHALLRSEEHTSELQS